MKTKYKQETDYTDYEKDIHHFLDLMSVYESFESIQCDLKILKYGKWHKYELTKKGNLKITID